MGLSVKIFIYDEESASLKKITNSKFNKLLDNDKTVSIKEYSNKTIKYITVIIQNKNRKPVAIVDKQYGILKIDKNGRIDSVFKSELDRDVMSIMASMLPTENRPNNVIEFPSDIARKKYKNKYSWDMPPEFEKKIQDLIFAKQKPRKLSEIIIEIAKTGFKDDKYFESVLMHTCMFLAHVAWNRDTKDPDYLKGSELTKNLEKLPHNKRKIRRELISENWEDILSKMIEYKRLHFPKDKR